MLFSFSRGLFLGLLKAELQEDYAAQVSRGIRIK